MVGRPYIFRTRTERDRGHRRHYRTNPESVSSRYGGLIPQKFPVESYWNIELANDCEAGTERNTARSFPTAIFPHRSHTIYRHQRKLNVFFYSLAVEIERIQQTLTLCNS